MLTNRYIWILTGLILIWAIISTSFAVQYYYKYNEVSSLYHNAMKTIDTINSNIKSKLKNVFSILMDTIDMANNAGEFNISSNVEYCLKDLKEICNIIGGKITINIGIDYGNGTRIWFNSTEINFGDTLFNATLKIAKVNYTIYPFGIFINSINNVSNDPKSGMYWIWWYWDDEYKVWKLGPIGCDKYVLSDESIVIWIYESTLSWPPKPP